MAPKKIVYAIAPPSTGHVNPMCSVVNEICKYPNIEVIFYSDEFYRPLIENSGAQFRALAHHTFSKLEFRPITERKLMFGEMLNAMITFGYDILPQLIADAERDQPDLIFYDCMFLPTKYLIEVIKSREAKGTWNRTVPKTVAFIPNFPHTAKSMKQFREQSQEDIWSTLAIMNSFRRQLGFSWQFDISVYNPIKFFSQNDPVLNIVSVTPELQPDREGLDDRYKFVGPCVSEDARSVEIQNDDELKNLLGEFDQKRDDSKLIFMSLGTVFNANSFIFERAFEAIRTFNNNGNKRSLKASQIKMVVSLGEISYKYFKTKIDQGEYDLPENILIRTRVPQLELLKRADLFITHCGMNSTTESIKYAVPVVAIPIQADQPMVSRRVCDELSLGIRLDALKFNSDELADAIERVLVDPKYKQNVCDMSNSLNKYNGAVEGARLVVDYIHTSN